MRTYLKRTLLVLLSFAVSAVICEGILSLAWKNPYRHAHQERIVRLRMHLPGEVIRLNRGSINNESPTVQMRIDQRGYILPVRQYATPDATIVFFGGSTTECAAVDEQLRFPALVAELLRGRHGLRITALNAGVSGSTVQDSLNLLLNHVVADRPDIAVLMHAANDIGVLAKHGSYQLAEPLDVNLPLRWMIRRASRYSSLVAAARLWLRQETVQYRGDATVQKDSATAVSSDEFVARLRAYVRTTRAFGIEPVLMTQPVSSFVNALTPGWTDPMNQKVFNQEVRRVAGEEGVVLIDLARHLSEEIENWEQPMVVFYDGIHVTDSGSRVYANYIVQRLVESLFTERPGP